MEEDISSIIKFTKAHGAGNDFIFLDQRVLKDIDFSSLATRICKRRNSIGADGLILLLESSQADFKMVYFNADGSRAVCANGLRCLAHFINYLGDFPRNKAAISIETDDGTKFVKNLTEEELRNKKLTSTSKSESYLQAEMGQAKFLANQIPFLGEGEQFLKDLTAAGVTFKISLANMGNPHCVIFVDDLQNAEVEKYGPEIENHPSFPERTNVEFVKVISPTELQMRVWERGVGETLACGTGNCAVFAIANRLDYISGAAKISSPGGEFFLEHGSMDDDSNVTQDNILLTGPAEIVYDGVLCL